MRSLLISIPLVLVFAGCTAPHVASQEIPPAVEAHPEIATIIQDYTQGADTRDVKRVASALHPTSVQYVKPPQGLLTLDRDEYLKLLESGKIGGEDRTLDIRAIDVAGGNVAMATVEIEGAMRFLQYISLVKTENGWQIVSILTSVQ